MRRNLYIWQDMRRCSLSSHSGSDVVVVLAETEIAARKAAKREVTKGETYTNGEVSEDLPLYLQRLDEKPVILRATNSVHMSGYWE